MPAWPFGCAWSEPNFLRPTRKYKSELLADGKKSGASGVDGWAVFFRVPILVVLKRNPITSPLPGPP